MASFRTGFKIFRDISLKQGLGRIRSFSEDRKPGQWLPEDQWAVRQPGSTCPEPCDKPKKPPKTSKSWLSICRDPDKEAPPECDIRHNNCPPPPETKESLPWYSLDNLIPKKKATEPPPPLSRCREEIRRRQMLEEEDEVCEKMKSKDFPVHLKPDPSECIMPKEPCPAPVVNILSPVPKEVNIALWCERPCLMDCCRVPIPCQSDRLPYSEFRPKKTWKPPPFSLPIRGDLSYKSVQCTSDCIIFSEFKQVEVPKPLYTRYKSVELCDQNLLFCMTNVTCPDDETSRHLQIPSRPLPQPCNSGFRCEPEEEEVNTKPMCPEKPILEAASCKPVRIKRGSVCKFRPKPTKLIERRVYKRPCAQYITSDPCRPQKEEDDGCTPLRSRGEAPKVITGTLTDEPQVLERCYVRISTTPPSWMYQLCKPGCQQTPLVPCGDSVAQEPDWCSETDGLRFYDGQDENICPKPSPDPWASMADNDKEQESPCCIDLEPIPLEENDTPEFRDRFVLMPEQYNIKFSRNEELEMDPNALEDTTFERFVQKQTAPKSFPQMKENILYDLQRLCPNPPIDPSVFNAPCRKPPNPDPCSPPKFYRSYSTLTPARGKLWSLRLCSVPRRTECEDTSGKCKPRKLVPKAKDCSKAPPKVYPSCAEIRLPCCQKSKAPPLCHMKEVKPICKKIPAPQPSFSECSRDLPPCPRITECDCWDKIIEKKEKERHNTNKT